MARSDEINTALDLVDTATTALGARVQKLIDDINRTATEGLNGPQTENALARLATIVTALTGMAADQAAPVPPIPATDPAMPGPFSG